MTQTTTRRGARSTAAAAPATLEIEVGRSGKHIFDRLANLRVARLLAQRDERPVKDQAEALWADAAKDLKEGDVLIVKAMGIVRGRVSLKRRAPVVDLDLLMTAFPEAYEACVRQGSSPQFDPA